MGFKLLMAVSSDGFLARGPDDDMRWTGHSDKKLFRLLTETSPDSIVLAGRKTAELLPVLPRRRVKVISRDHTKGITLQEASWAHGNSWLIGGPSVALEAVQANLVDTAVIVIAAANLGTGIPFGPLCKALEDREQGISPIDLADLRVLIYHDLQKFRPVSGS